MKEAILAALFRATYMRAYFFGLFLFPAMTVLAQQAPTDKIAPTDKGALASTVSGHVFCADTNAPARMATVMLEPVEAPDTHSSAGHDRATTYASIRLADEGLEAISARAWCPRCSGKNFAE